MVDEYYGNILLFGVVDCWIKCFGCCWVDQQDVNVLGNKILYIGCLFGGVIIGVSDDEMFDFGGVLFGSGFNIVQYCNLLWI